MSSQPSSSLRTRSPGILAASLASCLLFAACSGHETRTGEAAREPVRQSPPLRPPAPRTLTVGEEAAVVAVRQVGAPYRYGGNGVDGFDCSGLVQYAYSAAGKPLPRTTGDLWRQMQPIAHPDLEVGDVLFFNIEGKVSHVGLYLGSGRFVHAPSTGREVTIADLGSDFYRDAFIRGGRPL
jgi:cell wall-associated NlpC family hydrolase